MARPTKLSPSVQKRVVDALTAGNHIESACAYAAISESTYHAWKARGEAEESGPYAEFLEAIDAALAAAEVRAVANWQAAMPASWQACRDFLARRWPSRWGSDRKPDVDPMAGDFVIDLSPPAGHDDQAAEPETGE